ncbi:M24 family metallopeptidase (plasmid) [Sinorhizobium meliloti]|nr:M24 family metallopeptidase [Sinorhizobium meliloti]
MCANALQAWASAGTRITTASSTRSAQGAGGGRRPFGTELCYDFPGATCISFNEEIAHALPGRRVIQPGRISSISTFPRKGRALRRYGGVLSRAAVKTRSTGSAADGKRAMWVGLKQSSQASRLPRSAIRSASSRARTATPSSPIWASHGIGRSLHEEPSEIATWPDPSERRRMTEGMVFTVEPFLSMGAQWAEGGNDDWTLYSEPRAPTVQYEHTVVVTRSGPLVVTLPA